jgi:beta-1,2-mannobiose phosphorylase / 1,2-beta-oligomannan phosphorylase
VLLDSKRILKRYPKNPILVPNEDCWWESKAVFNCAISYDGQMIHMLYRAVGEYEKYISRIGYASSKDGYKFNKMGEIAFAPRENYEKYGIEDPRLIKINNQIYVTYVVPSGYVRDKPNVFSAVATTENYREFTRLGIIKGGGMDNKDVVFFPEKFDNGSTDGNRSTVYLSLHRPSAWIGSAFGTDRPSIWLGEGKSLTNIERHTLLLRPEREWEALKIGAGVPPIKTDRGWLIIYHGVSKEKVYSVGAALLDLKKPNQILGRTKRPILVPEERYEKLGDVNNVVFPTGACIVDRELFVYYGGADKVCCLAIADLGLLLDFILHDD